MSIKKRIAICLYGSLGYKETLFGKTNKNQVPLEIEEPVNSLLENVIRENKCDVFIHSWSVDRKDQLIEILKPVSSYFEEHKQFAKDINSIKNSVRSRFYSQNFSNKLKKEYEDNKFKYDVVMHSRMDLMWFNKLDLLQDVDDSIFASHWNISEKSEHLPQDKSNDNNNLGPFDRSNYGVGSGLIDHWFFSSSKNMDNFAKIYSNTKNLQFKTSIKSIKEKKSIRNKWSYNPNHFCYLQAKEYGLNIEYILYRGHDYDLYRRYKNKNYFKK